MPPFFAPIAALFLLYPVASGLKAADAAGPVKGAPADRWTRCPLQNPVNGPSAPEPPAGAQAFTVDPPTNTAGPVVQLTDFGAVADGGAPPTSGPDRNQAAFAAAIAKCRELGASRLTVPRGIYRITSGDSVVFEGLHDFTFDGGGSTFLYHKIHGGVPGMLIKNCTRTVFANFNLDWDWKVQPLASIGRVTKVAPDRSFFEMHFDTVAPTDPQRWTTMNPLDEKLLVPGAGQEFGLFGSETIEALDPHTVRVRPAGSVPVKAGQLYRLRHYTYEKPALVMENNAHLSLNHVTIFSFPGMGFICEGDQHHFELSHCRITFPDGNRRAITTTADGLHVAESQGYIRVEDCDFGYMGDDCINIHDIFVAGLRRRDDRTLVAENISPWRCRFAAGDPVEVRHGDYSPTGFADTLKSATLDNQSKELTLIFNRELPAAIGDGVMVFNHRYHSQNCIIRHCYFHENRARGVLCNTAGWLIEGNHFFHNQHSAIILTADSGPNWTEGFGARDLIIRNNRFDWPDTMGQHEGAAIYVSADINGKPSSYSLLENIRVENNRFQELTGPALEARSFQNLVFRDNTIAVRKPPATDRKMRGGITAELGSGLWVEGNRWTTANNFPAPALFYDARTTSQVVCRGNQVESK